MGRGIYIYRYFLEVNLPYDPVCPSVGWLIGRSVGRSVIISKRTGSLSSMPL